MENTILTQELQIQRKDHSTECCENDRGRFLRISRETHGRRCLIFAPDSRIAEFFNAFSRMLAAAPTLTPA